jgi:catechol 2,3-dioxygenase-like lactoylglutathione lyase family enzyme
MSHPAIGAQITFLYTPDLLRTARFYEEMMGLHLRLDQGSCRIYETGQDSYLGICQRKRPPVAASQGTRDQVIVTLVAPDVDAWYEYLKARGVELEQAPKINPTYGIYHFFLRDPNGYLLEIQRFLDPF